MSRGSLRTKIIPADSIATLVPAPMAIPRSACVSAGASFTPSPTIATFCPFNCKSFTFSDFLSGNTRAKYSSMPNSPATHLATSSESPVIIAVLIPKSRNALIASRDSSRIMSASAIAPIIFSAVRTKIIVLPCDDNSPIFFCATLSKERLCSPRSASLPTKISLPSIIALAPLPAIL